MSCVRFILDSMKKEYYKGTKYPATFDHWRPQHKLCPFCLINFRWEEMLTNFVSSSIIFDHFSMQNIFPAWRKWWRRALLLHQSWPRLWLWACEGECAGREGEGCQYGHDAWEVDIEFFLPCKDLSSTNPTFIQILESSWAGVGVGAEPALVLQTRLRDAGLLSATILWIVGFQQTLSLSTNVDYW